MIPGIGRLPPGWTTISGVDLTELISKGASPRWQGFAYGNDGMLFVTSENVRDGYLDVSTPKFLPLAFHEKLGRTKLRRDDILVNLVGASIGRSCRVKIDLGPANINQAVAVFRVRESRSAPYVEYFFQAPATIKRILEMQADAARPNISLGNLRSFVFALPALAEQVAIATALNDVDALLGALDRLIAKKRDLKQAAMQQLLTGQTRLPGFTGKWETKGLGEILDRIANGAVYVMASRDGVAITRIETIANGSIDFARTGLAKWSSALADYELRAGDILFSHINSIDHIGKVARFLGDRPLYHGMNLLLLRAGSACDSTFLYYWLTSQPARRCMRTLAKQAVSQASINTSELRLVSLELPSIQEQIAIATALTDMDAELASLEQRRDKTRFLKQGMMQELLTGRTRLV